MSEDVRNAFISHIHEDDDGLQKLKSLVREKGMTVRDASITKGKFNSATDPDYIKYGILSKRIDWAGVLVVYVSPETKDDLFVKTPRQPGARWG